MVELTYRLMVEPGNLDGRLLLLGRWSKRCTVGGWVQFYVLDCLEDSK